MTLLGNLESMVDQYEQTIQKLKERIIELEKQIKDSKKE